MEKGVDFCLRDHNNKEVCLSKIAKRYRYVIVYFYPKDNTPGCTLEAVEFSKLAKQFDKLGIAIIGISKDSVESHRKFKEKFNLKIRLLSDESAKVIKAYGCWKLKSIGGKRYYGTERSTFLIDSKLNIIKAWRKVKPKGHAKEVLEFVKNLKV